MSKFLLAVALFTQLHIGSYGVNAAHCDQWERTYTNTWVSESADIQLSSGKWVHLKNVESVAGSGFAQMLDYFCRDEPSVLCASGPCTGGID